MHFVIKYNVYIDLTIVLIWTLFPQTSELAMILQKCNEA